MNLPLSSLDTWTLKTAQGHRRDGRQHGQNTRLIPLLKTASPRAPRDGSPHRGFHVDVRTLLSLWVGLCIAVGIGLGHLFPEVFQLIGAAEIAKVNLPVAVLVWLMIIPMLIKIDFAALSKVTEHGGVSASRSSSIGR